MATATASLRPASRSARCLRAACSTSEATETPSGAAYGNPLRRRPEHSPSVPIGSALLARTDAADARGWRVYRVTPAGTVIYDEWIEDDAASGELAVTQLRAAARRSPEAALRRAVDEQSRRPRRGAGRGRVARQRAGRAPQLEANPDHGPHGAGGAAASRAAELADEALLAIP